MNESIWFEPTGDPSVFIARTAPQDAVDFLETQESEWFRTRLLNRRADEFVSRVIFEFIMEDKRS